MFDYSKRKAELEANKAEIENAINTLVKQHKQLEANYNAVLGALQLINEIKEQEDITNEQKTDN